MGELIEFNKKSNKKIVVVILIVVTAVVLLVINSITPILGPTSSKKQASVTFEDTSYTLGKSGKNAVLCSDDEIIGVDKSGQSVWKYKLSYKNPIMSYNDNYIAVADIGGTELKLFSGSKQVLVHQSDGEIITATVNKSGRFAVATKEKGYKSRICVYDNKGKQIFAWHFAEYDVIDIALSDYNNTMAVAVLNSDIGGSFSSVLMFSFNSDKYKVFAESEDNLFSGIYYSGRNIICLGDKNTVGISSNGKTQWTIDYKGRTLQEFSFYEGGVLAMGFTKSSMDSLRSGSVVEIYSKSGKLKGSYETNYAIGCMDVEGGNTFLNTEDATVVINDNAKVISELSLRHTVKDGIIFDGKVLILSGNTVNLYDF